MNDIPFSDCVVIGVDLSPDLLRADGDVLIGTQKNTVLFSEGIMYFNGEQVGTANSDVLDAIRDAMKSVSQMIAG